MIEECKAAPSLVSQSIEESQTHTYCVAKFWICSFVEIVVFAAVGCSLKPASSFLMFVSITVSICVGQLFDHPAAAPQSEY